MTNEQMQKYFGIEGYRTISIALKEHANAGAVTDEIRKVVSGVSDCVVKDYTEQIKVQNFYLNQKMLFFYGIALALLVISLLHIMNSMQYLVAARKHVTDSGFRMMLAKKGCGMEFIQHFDDRTLSGGTKSVILFYDTCIFVSASKIRSSDRTDSGYDPD